MIATFRVPYTSMHQYEERFQKALELAVYYQNRCCELTEIIELVCEDAEAELKDRHHD